MSATIPRVARPRGALTKKTLDDLDRRRRRADFEQQNYRDAVVDALDEGSFTAVSEATGLSTNTLQRWKREAGR